MVEARRASKGAKKRAPPRAYHHGNLRDALVAASVELLAEEGISGLTLRSAARRVGVSHAAPKNHFGDLRGLLVAVAADGFQRLSMALATAYRDASHLGAAKALLAVGPAYVAFALAAPGHFRAMFHPSLADRTASGALDSASRETFALLVGAMRAAREEGSVREVDVVEASLSAWSVVHGLATLAVDDQLRRKGLGADPRVLAEVVVGHLFEGLRAGPGALEPPRTSRKSRRTAR